MDPIVYRADTSRLVLRLPSATLGMLAVGSAVGLAAGSRHSLSLLVMATAAFVYLRFWAARTRLVVDGTGVSLSMPFSIWHAPWAGIASIGVMPFLTPTHRGGVGAGVVLRSGDGASRSIPDVFPVRRDELARELARCRAELRGGES